MESFRCFVLYNLQPALSFQGRLEHTKYFGYNVRIEGLGANKREKGARGGGSVSTPSTKRRSEGALDCYWFDSPNLP